MCSLCWWNRIRRCRLTIREPKRLPTLSKTNRRPWRMADSAATAFSRPSNCRPSAHRSMRRSSREAGEWNATAEPAKSVTQGNQVAESFRTRSYATRANRGFFACSFSMAIVQAQCTDSRLQTWLAIYHADRATSSPSQRHQAVRAFRRAARRDRGVSMRDAFTPSSATTAREDHAAARLGRAGGSDAAEDLDSRRGVLASLPRGRLHGASFAAL